MQFFGNVHLTVYNIRIQMGIIYCRNILSINTKTTASNYM